MRSDLLFRDIVFNDPGVGGAEEMVGVVLIASEFFSCV